MSIKKGKTRIIITLPDTQIAWIKNMAKKSKLTVSKFISWFFARKAEEIYLFLKFKEDRPSKAELDEMIDMTRYSELTRIKHQNNLDKYFDEEDED